MSWARNKHTSTKVVCTLQVIPRRKYGRQGLNSVGIYRCSSVSLALNLVPNVAGKEPGEQHGVRLRKKGELYRIHG